MDRNQIQSPIELDESGWRGKVRGVTRISAKAGFAAVIVLAALFGMIVYGISTAGHRRSSATTATLTKGSEHQEPWWNRVPNAEPSSPRLPPPAQIPKRVPPLSTEASSPRVPAGAQTAAQMQALQAEEREQRQQALLEAAAVAPVLVRLTEGGVSALPMPPTQLSAAAMPGSVPRRTESAMQSQDAQGERTSFLASAGAVSSDLLVVERQNDPSPYELHAGSVIPATLLTGINADLPGTIVGQVRDDVFDSVTGTYLLIPRGTKLVGAYDSRIVQGQRRVLVAWTRLLYPDGTSMDISGMAGTDPAGYAGFAANVDEHLGNVFKSALLLSIIGAGAQLSQPQQSGSIYAPPGIGQTIAGAIGQQIGNTSIQLTQRQLQVPPTLEVPPGYLFDVLVDRDIVLAAPYIDAGAP